MLTSTLNRFALTAALVAASLGAFAQQSAPLSMDTQAEKEYLERRTKQEAPINVRWDAAHAAPPRPVVPAEVMQRAASCYRSPAVTYMRKEPYTAVWPELNERDVIWKKRVWRTIDAGNPANSVLAPKGTSPNFAGILAGLALQGKCRTYSDYYFTKALTGDEIMERVKEGSRAFNGNFDFAQITRYKIKEDWMYDGKSNQLIVRLIAIAPVLQYMASDGVTTETPAFWIYFPDARPALAQQSIGSSAGQVSSLDEWLDMHRFAGEIDKIAIMKMPGD